MARIAIHEPVQETRELLERLLLRLGHDVVPAGPDPDVQHDVEVDAFVFEAGSVAGLAAARRLRDARPHVGLVACSARPLGLRLTELGRVEALVQPFSPAQLRRALDGALAPG